jgi:hypothetical protein
MRWRSPTDGDGSDVNNMAAADYRNKPAPRVATV